MMIPMVTCLSNVHRPVASKTSSKTTNRQKQRRNVPIIHKQSYYYPSAVLHQAPSNNPSCLCFLLVFVVLPAPETTSTSSFYY